MSKAILSKLAGALLLAGSANMAQAATITLSDSFDVSGTPGATATHTGGVTTDDSDTNTSTVTFAGFDSSLGTLTGVTLSFSSDWQLDGYINASYSNSNDGTNPSIGAMGSVGGQYSVSVGGASITDQSVKNEFCFGAGACDSNDLSNGQAPQNAPIGDSLNQTISIISDLDSFIDQAIEIDFSQMLSASLSRCSTSSGIAFDNQTSCSLSNGDNSFWRGDVQISFAYDTDTKPPVSVSEPGAIALLGFGLMGLGLSRRKAKA